MSNYGVELVSLRARHRWGVTEESGLTERQAAIHRYLYEHTRDHGYQPNYRDVQDRFEFASTQSVKSHLAALIRKGWITVEHGESRAIRFLRRPDGTPFTGFRD